MSRGRGPRKTTEWNGYLANFHERKAGITEHVLETATASGQNPYEWTADVLPRGARVLDLACGSEPVARFAPLAITAGVDRSHSELAQASRWLPGAVAAADAASLPMGAAAFDAVVCAMGLMVLRPVGAVLSEIRRVLRPRGVVVALLPCGGPLTIRDRGRYLRLLVALRRSRFQYPSPIWISRPRRPLRALGFEVVSASRRRFSYPLLTTDQANVFVDSLYLPGGSRRHREAAKRVVAGWAGSDLGIPLRRIVAQV